MANRQRLRKIADQIQRELSAILHSDLRDPRVGLITITEVDVSPDLTHARVYYTTLTSKEARAQTEEGLRRATGFMRTALGQRIGLHVTPELRFQFDESVERGARLSALIDRAVSGKTPDRE